jgi:hypothetical protein
VKNAPERPRIPRTALVVAGLVSAALYGMLAATPDLAARPLRYLVVHGLLTVVLVAVLAVVHREGGSGLRLLLAGAVVFRLVLLAAPPLLSPDVHRYLWDGEVASAGINPYAWPPDDTRLDGVESSHRTGIIYPELPTIYPPASQAVFHAVAAAGAGVLAWKAIVVAADLGVLLLLVSWPRTRRPWFCTVGIRSWWRRRQDRDISNRWHWRSRCSEREGL